MLRAPKMNSQELWRCEGSEAGRMLRPGPVMTKLFTLRAAPHSLSQVLQKGGNQDWIHISCWLLAGKDFKEQHTCTRRIPFLCLGEGDGMKVSDGERAQLNTLGNTKVIRLSCWASVRILNRQQRETIDSREVLMAVPRRLQPTREHKFSHPPGLKVYKRYHLPSGVTGSQALQGQRKNGILGWYQETGASQEPRRISKGPKQAGVGAGMHGSLGGKMVA